MFIIYIKLFVDFEPDITLLKQACAGLLVSQLGIS